MSKPRKQSGIGHSKYGYGCSKLVQNEAGAGLKVQQLKHADGGEK
jgi:hypothetical protein